MSANDTQISGETERIIAEEFQRLLESPLFIRSPVLSRLLQFLVEHRLRGGRSAPKAYAIATEALGRSADFDPAVDSYPRVMVGRLRSLLDRYYAETPWIHRLRVPQGSYEVVVQYRTGPPARTPGESEADPSVAVQPEPLALSGGTRAAPRRAAWLLWLLIAAAALLAAWKFAGDPRRFFTAASVSPPVLEVSAPQAGDSADAKAIARALEGKLRDGIRRFELVDLLSAKRPGAAESADPVDYRLDSLIVQTEEGPVEVTLVLNRVADQRTIWSQQFRVGLADLPEFTAVEPAIAQIAGDHGLIVRDRLRSEPDNFAPGFPCLAQFNHMRPLEGDAQRIDACLHASLKADPMDPAVLSALSLVSFGEWEPRRGTPAGDKAFAEARRLAEQAYQNSPGATPGLFAMARARFYAGDCAGADTMADAALRLNPYDADMTGLLGLYKLGCGLDEQGEALLRRGLALDPSYPGLPGVALAFMLSRRGDQDKALAMLDQMPPPIHMEPQYMMVRVIVLARQGKLAEARGLWRRVLAHAREPANAPPERVLRHFVVAPIIVQRIAEGLRETGVVPAAPAAPSVPRRP